VDIAAAARLVAEFDEPTAAIIKHTNPCGVGSGTSLMEAYAKALATDATSAYGGIVALNRPVDRDSAAKISEIFTEVIVAPEFPEPVLEFLKKKKDRRLVRISGNMRALDELEIKSVPGGLLVQSPDRAPVTRESLKVVTRREPTDAELTALLYAWRVAHHVKSNAIVYAREDRTVGIGAGQMSRVDSSRIAAQKAASAGLDLKGTVVASDAFFPFADGLMEAVKAGSTAVIQPGGSVRDEDVIRAAILRLVRRGYGLLLDSEGESGAAGRGPSLNEMEAGLNRTVRDIFNLLGLIHPQEDIRKAFQNLSAGTRKNIEYSLELLDTMLKRDIKSFLLPLIDDAPHEERVRRCRKLLPALDKALAP
jgi:hypothetical protein